MDVASLLKQQPHCALAIAANRSDKITTISTSGIA